MSSKPPRNQPPRRADALLEAWCSAGLLEDIQGDIHELYHKRSHSYGRMVAQLLYWWDVLWFLRPYLLKRSAPYQQARGPIMWRNYLVVAWRTMFKYRMYSTINVLGLAMGLAVCLLIFLFVQDERSYDTFFSDADQIHRVRALFESQQVKSHEAMLAYPAADLLENDFPEIEHSVRLISVGSSPLFVKDDRRFYEDGFYFADSDFFEVFDLPFLYGDPATALVEPAQVVITSSVAQKYFGETNVVGQTFSYDNRVDLTVSGVIDDLPSNTHFAFEIVASRETLVSLFGERIMNNLQNWGWPSTYTYIKLNPTADPEVLQAKLPEFMDRNEAQDALSIFLQPLKDIHLHSHLELEMQPNGDIAQVYTFSAIALLILLIACINFMNLSTARSTLRAKEVGMRKVVGARRGQVITQFLGQSVMMTMLALVLALVFVQLALPGFNEFLDKDLVVGYLSNPLVPLGLLAVGLLVGIGAGSYPAFYLSAAKSLDVLRGEAARGLGRGRVRQGLVVIQFAISIMLVVVTGTVYSQMQFAKNLKLGYEKDQVVIVSGLNRIADEDSFETLRTRLLQHSNIASLTASSIVPTQNLFAGTGFRLPGGDEEEPLFYRIVQVEHNFFDTYGIDIVSGRGFSRDFGADRRLRPTDDNPHVQSSIILNEAAALKAGWSPEEAVGKTLMQGGDERSITYTVVGVSADIHFSSVHSEIEPAVFFVDPNGYSSLAVKVATADLSSTLAYLDEAWNAVVPNYPITRTFLDDRFGALYEQEERTGQVITAFAILAIFIACLGLLGLAAFMAERRRKEIGVRKVMGASVRDIILMLSWDFTKLVLVANVIAWPAAYFLANAWLQDFAYRTEIGVMLFILASGVAFLVAWVTVGLQAGRAAVTNPVTAIRDE